MNFYVTGDFYLIRGCFYLDNLNYLHTGDIILAGILSGIFTVGFYKILSITLFFYGDLVISGIIANVIAFFSGDLGFPSILSLKLTFAALF